MAKGGSCTRARRSWRVSTSARCRRSRCSSRTCSSPATTASPPRQGSCVFVPADGAPLTAAQLQSTAAAAHGLPRSAQSCGNNFAVDVLHAVQATDARFALACAPNGGGAQPGADTLTIRRASASVAEPDAGRLQLLSNRLVAANQLLFVGPAMPSGSARIPGTAQLRDLLLHSYYVARHADGYHRNELIAALPALRVKALTAVAGAPAFIDTESSTASKTCRWSSAMSSLRSRRRRRARQWQRVSLRRTRCLPARRSWPCASGCGPRRTARARFRGCATLRICRPAVRARGSHPAAAGIAHHHAAQREAA